MQGRFVDVRMQDCYNVVKCLQDLACLDASTATLFFGCCGFSNLSALISWPEPDMRHARWAACVVLKEVCFCTSSRGDILLKKDSSTGVIYLLVGSLQNLVRRLIKAVASTLKLA